MQSNGNGASSPAHVPLTFAVIDGKPAFDPRPSFTRKIAGDWRGRYGKANEHNGWVPRDFWLEEWEKQAIVGFHLKNPLEKKVNIPMDVVIQPHRPRRHRVPILMECKSAGDFTNVNKRQKEEATKIGQIHKNPETADGEFVLFLCGYFDGSYLGYEAMDGIDWIWEHRIQDMDQLGL